MKTLQMRLEELACWCGNELANPTPPTAETAVRISAEIVAVLRETLPPDPPIPPPLTREQARRLLINASWVDGENGRCLYCQGTRHPDPEIGVRHRTDCAFYSVARDMG